MSQNVITIDGGAGVGKTTVGTNLAKLLNIPFISTGKIFRALAWLFLQQNTPLFEQYSIDEILNLSYANDLIDKLTSNFTIQFVSPSQCLINGVPSYFEDLDNEQIANVSSKLSSIKEIRSVYENVVHGIINNHPEGVVLEGRDCGTVIAPNAKHKFFLTCSLEKQVEHRLKDYQGTNITKEQLMEKIKQRDLENKTRKLSPLVPAPDAIIIDCTNLNIDQTTQKIYKKIKP